MEYAVGLVLALLVSSFARLVGFDRDRSFYPVVLIVIASYYVLFAVMGDRTGADSGVGVDEWFRGGSRYRPAA